MLRVLIVDDSSLVRSILRDFLESSGKFRVAEEAANGREAVEKALSLNPDLVTMDIEMPVMNGLDAIGEIRKTLAVPVVVISTHDTAKMAYEATARGAMEFYAKDLFTADMPVEKRARILDALVHIAGVKGKLPILRDGKFSFDFPPAPRNPPLEPRSGPEGAADPAGGRGAGRRVRALVIAASTGGPRALCSICGALPGNFPVPILLVQHNSSGFDRGFVQWLNGYTQLDVVLAAEGDLPAPGKIYMAPTDRHLIVGREGCCAFDNGPPEHNQKPAADLLFRSAAKYYGAGLVSLVLTGMGADGAEGTRAVKEAGGFTLAQDEQSSMIYGMPRVARETGCVDQVVALDRIPRELVLLAHG
ncbi:MAG: chemotaxis-specific protein-glutamate methyltransferase CheB [Treponema sp.]|jgi:two-component system chemotaxis response regulator CheB|nr:chemotaxis-specific protein-glutamate methyltransferase CheB [Treponema sp.]